MDQKLHDSGERRTFSSGAQRDRGTLKPRPDLISPHAQMREGMIFALGAEKYDERNWEKGMEISECIASAQRHIEQWKLGLKDEDHLAQARWNLGAIIHYEEEIAAGRMDPAFADMPHYTQRPTREILGSLVNATLADMPDPSKSLSPNLDPTKDYIWCPLCGSPLKSEPYETGKEYHCTNHTCKWSTLDDPKPGDQRMGPDGPEMFVKHVDPASQDQDYSICQIFRPPVVEPGKSLPATFYICGPMRGLPFLNFPAFDGARDLGKSLGYDVISPADMDRMYGIDPIEDPASPERVYNKNPNFVHDVAERDVEIILRLRKDLGDGLALLPGWQASVGGMAEVRLAYWLGLKFVDARNWKPIDMDAELEMQV